MSNRRRLSTWVGSGILVAAVGGLLMPIAWSQAPGPQLRSQEYGRETLQHCRAVLGEIKVMQGEVATLDQRLEEKLTLMQAASEPEQLDATLAVIEEIVTQRKAMWRMMKGTHQKMVVHLMEHLIVDDETGKPSLYKCPSWPTCGRSTLAAAPATRTGPWIAE